MRVVLRSHEGTLHSFDWPLHEAVARIEESGEKAQYDSGRSSPI